MIQEDGIRSHTKTLNLILKKYEQYFSSNTVAELISSEDAPSLQEVLSRSMSGLRPSPQTTVCVRVDNASGFRALKDDLTLSSLNIISRLRSST